MVGLGNVILREMRAPADYDSLQLTANRRYIRGFSAAATYTFSRTRDNISTVPMYQDPHEYLYDYSTQDRRHLASVSMTWDLPMHPWNNVASRAILNNWQIAAVGLFASGGPAAVTFTTVDNADITGGGDPGRINMNCDPNDFKHTFDKWFDTSCFSRPARGDFGNAPRQMIRLPGSQVWDLTFSKNFPMGRGGPASSVPRRALQRVQPEYLDVARYGCALRRPGESNQPDIRPGERRRRAAGRPAFAPMDVLGIRFSTCASEALMREFRIAVLPGDGIGREVMAPCLDPARHRGCARGRIQAGLRCARRGRGTVSAHRRRHAGHRAGRGGVGGCDSAWRDGAAQHSLPGRHGSAASSRSS